MVKQWKILEEEAKKEQSLSKDLHELIFLD